MSNTSLTMASEGYPQIQKVIGKSLIEEVEDLNDVGARLLEKNEQISILVEIVGATNLLHPSSIPKNGQSSSFFSSSIIKSAKKLVTTTPPKDSVSVTGQEDGLKTDDRICNPYIVVTYKNEIIHTTKTIFNDNNPVWDVQTHSLFLFKVKPKEFIESDDKLIITTCHDATTFGKVKIIGRTAIDAETILYNCDEERIEFELEHPDAENKKQKKKRSYTRISPSITRRQNNSSPRQVDKRSRKALDVKTSVKRDKDTASYSIIDRDYTPNVHARGQIAMRFRMAHKKDVTFLETIHKNHMRLKPIPNEAELPSERDETEVVGEQVMHSVMFNLRKVGKVFHTQDDGTPRVKVKPGPDPGRPHRLTEWLSKDELVRECMAPSTNWVVTGTGCDGKPSSALDQGCSRSLGRVYLEILSCQDLPNLDVGGAVGNYTDPFVCAIFEDSIVETNVINDELSPLWMPWSQRAFVFNMKHPLSALYLAVFDYDSLGEHDGIGRVAVNLQNLKPQTNYTLRYKLHPSAIVCDRTVSLFSRS